MPNLFEYTTKEQRKLPLEAVANIRSYLANNNWKKTSDIHQSERPKVASHLAEIIRVADPSHVLIEPLQQWSGYEVTYGKNDLLTDMIGRYKPRKRRYDDIEEEAQVAKDALLDTIVGPQQPVLQPGCDASISRLRGALTPHPEDSSVQAMVMTALRIDMQKNHPGLLATLDLTPLTDDEVNIFVANPENTPYLAMGIYIGYTINPYFDFQGLGENGKPISVAKTGELVSSFTDHTLRHGIAVPALKNPEAGGRFTKAEARDKLGATSFLLGVFRDRYSARVFEGTWQRYVCVDRAIVVPQVASGPHEVCITSLLGKHDSGQTKGGEDGEAHGVFITVIPHMERKTREFGLEAAAGISRTVQLSNRRDFTPSTPSATIARADSLPGVGGSSQKRQKVQKKLKNLFSFGFGSSKSSSE